jgi:hypothetical protein
MSGERYLVVPDSFFSALASHDSAEAAITLAAHAVERDKKPRLVVCVMHAVKPRTTPNVEVVPFVEADSDAEAENG